MDEQANETNPADLISFNLRQIKDLQDKKTALDEYIEGYRNDTKRLMEEAGLKSKDFDLATVSIVSGARYISNISPDLFEERYGTEYIEVKKSVNSKKLKKEKPELYEQHFFKEEKPATLRITFNKQELWCCDTQSK